MAPEISDRFATRWVSTQLASWRQFIADKFSFPGTGLMAGGRSKEANHHGFEQHMASTATLLALLLKWTHTLTGGAPARAEGFMKSIIVDGVGTSTQYLVVDTTASQTATTWPDFNWDDIATTTPPKALLTIENGNITVGPLVNLLHALQSRSHRHDIMYHSSV